MPALQPTGLMIELLAHPELTQINSAQPKFCWIVNSTEQNAFQQAYRILVASSRELLSRDVGDMWDSGEPNPGGVWRSEPQSVGIEYAGSALKSNTEYFWKVRTWLSVDDVGPWSEVQRFVTGDLSDNVLHAHYDPVVSIVQPVQFVELSENHVFVDFGRAAFGTVRLTLDSPISTTIEFHLGEVLNGSYEIDRNPGGSRRYQMIPLKIRKSKHSYQLVIPPNERNTADFAIKMPDTLFEVYPFRYCEILGFPVPLDRTVLEQVIVHYPFDDLAAQFTSSSKVLNDVWNLCHYTMKATSFCGYYVDGDRERIPYEADAYINQLGHYACDREYTLARRTLEHLITTPTWPTEWFLYAVLAAWNDYMFTGDSSMIAQWYPDLSAKALIGLSRGDGLISSDNMTSQIMEEIHFSGRSAEQFGDGIRDIVDWPQVERDGHEMCSINSVVNALHYRALLCLSGMAGALGMREDISRFADQAALVKSSFLQVFLDEHSGLILDGENSNHSSLHANLFAVAAGLISDPLLPPILKYVRSRGMACSVSASQMLFEALYLAGDDSYALSLLTSVGERSWAHMIYDIGTTIALEAWDNRIKPNQDWNHAWGAAPANVIPFGLMGITPLEPGFAKVSIDPKPGDLPWAEVTIPTIRGPISVRFTNHPARRFVLECDLPANTAARIGVPALHTEDDVLTVDGKPVFAERKNGHLYVDGIGSGKHTVVR